MTETVREIEAAMSDIMTDPMVRYEKIVAEYNRLLKIMGNVDGDEGIALALLAYDNVLLQMMLN